MKRNIVTAIVLVFVTILAILTPLMPLDKLPIPFVQEQFSKLKYNISRHEYTEGLTDVISISAYQGNVLLADPEAADFRYDIILKYNGVSEDFF